ncbi:MAG: hypothetical protein II720_03175 [Bacteroidales bacterium]|nr:hypothetical protein [Bacteroidales bacterium]
MKVRILLAVLLLAGSILRAQPARGPFSFADSLMRHSRIGMAGRQHMKPVAVRPSIWEPKEYDPSLGVVYASQESDFVMYLLDRGLRTDALTLLARPCLVPSDTLAFLRGLALFDDLQLEGADRWFSLSSLEPALFYSTVAKAHLGRGAEAVPALKSYGGPYKELSDMQLAGLALIRSDMPAYREAASRFTYSDYNLTESERAIDAIAASMEKRHRKSPLAAAAFSALLPGSGQLYAGSLGEAVASFLMVGAMGGITAVTWNKYGIKSWRTIVAASTTALFYIGNIYGAYVSVGIQQQQLQDETSAMVMYHIHIPLRSLFR